MHSVDRTVAIGKRAVELMRAYCESAAPRAYELWYTFVTGLKPDLNDAVKAIVADRQMLSGGDVDRLYECHFVDGVLDHHADRATSAVLVEMSKVIGLVETALGSAEVYGSSLDSMKNDLRHGPDGTKLREIVETLLEATKTVAASNRALEGKLHASLGEVEALRRALEEVRVETMTDPLTGIANRKQFELTLDTRIAQSARERSPFVLMMIDIDHFRRFNDSFGHTTGDQILRLVAMAMREVLGEEAVLARFGGEEFAVLIASGDEATANASAEALRKNVMCRELLRRSSNESLGRVTVSIGIAAFRPNDSVASLLERADLCLYRAKVSGRNRTVSDWEPQRPSLASAA